MSSQAQTLPVQVSNVEMGRPTKYRSEYAEQAYKLALLGATDEEMANFFSVSRSTFALWKKQMPDFSDTVKRGKALADANVAAALYKKAVGYEYPSEKIMNVNNEVVRVPTITHVPPDPGAAFNWLKNRRPREWRDKQQVELSGEISVTLNLEGEGDPSFLNAGFSEAE